MARWQAFEDYKKRYSWLDDDQQFIGSSCLVLNNRGHRVFSAHTATEASSAHRRQSIDLNCDGQLTDTHGIELIPSYGPSGKKLCDVGSAYGRDAAVLHKTDQGLGVTLCGQKPILPSVCAAEVDIILGKGSRPDRNRRTLKDTVLALRTEYARERRRAWQKARA